MNSTQRSRGTVDMDHTQQSAAMRDADQQSDMEQVAAYVSRLKARRTEENASRKMRSQRRADTVISNMEAFKQRSSQQRRRLMNEKLHMTSQIEHHLFSMLDEQAKWRHVMYQNVVDQDAHLDEMSQQQSELDTAYLKNLAHEEREIFAETVADDRSRWDTLHEQHQRAHDEEAAGICRDILEDVQHFAEKIIDFDVVNDLANDPEPPVGAVAAVAGPTVGAVSLDATATSASVTPRPATAVTPAVTSLLPPKPESAFDRVPRPLFTEWVNGVVYPTISDREEKVLQDHISLRVCRAPEGTLDGSVSDNSFFAGLTLKLQQLNQPPPPLFAPVNPMPKAIVVLAGAKYAGKSAVGQQTAQQLNMWYMSDVDMIQAALNEIEREISPADLQQEEEVIQAALLDIGVEIRRVLNEGQEVGDDLLTRLVLNRIEAVASTDFAGIIFDGSPASRAVFENVERVLSGYDADRPSDLPVKALAPVVPLMPEVDDPMFVVERPPTPPPEATGKDGKKAGGETKAKKDKKGKDDSEDPLPPIELPTVDPVPPLTEAESMTLRAIENDKDKFATHAVVNLTCEPDELFRRFNGLRVDVDEEGSKYHLETNPPPLERMARIAPLDRAEGDAVDLHVAVAGNENAELVDWLQRYCTVASVNSQRPLAEVTKAVTAVVESTVSAAQRDYECQVAAKQLLSQRQEMEELFTERTANREALRKQLAIIYTERGVDPLPAELVDVVVKDENENRALPIPTGLPSLYLRLLDDFTEYYTHGLYHIHGEMAKLVETVFAENRFCVSQFDAFWKQADTKQPLLTAFCSEFNLMQPALRRDVQGKEELHLRTDALAESLWHIAEKRRDEANTVVDQLLAHSAFVDLWCDAVRMLGGSLIQLELERFYMVKQLSLLYFNGLKADPVTFDESDIAVEVIPLPRGSTADPAATTEPQGRGKEKAKPAPKKGAAKAVEKEPPVPAHDDGDHKVEDHFPGVVDRAVAAMKSTVDRLNGPTTPAQTNPKDKKKVVQEVAPTPDIPTAGSLAMPIVSAEVELARKRMEAIGRYIHHVIDDGYTRCTALMRSKLQQKLKKHFVDEMAAVNGAIFHVRTAIEEERPIQHALVLDGPRYCVDMGHPLVAPRNLAPISTLGRTTSAGDLSGSAGLGVSATMQTSQLVPADEDSLLTSTLTLKRTEELVRVFQKVAPDYLLYKADFLTVVRESDFNCVQPVASVETVFDRFDLMGCGAIDWREFMVHILFFCEPQFTVTANAPHTPKTFGASVQPPNPYFVEPPSLFQLFDFRNDVGNELLPRDEYDEIPFFFETQMEEERLESYRDVLWTIFSRTGVLEEGMEPELLLDPNVLVMFFCADEQPLRGIQKAFAMAASVADENCTLTLEQMNNVFHFNACDATKLHMEDPYDGEAILSLFQSHGGIAESLTFQEACTTQNGRMLFNNTFMYRQRTFLADPVEEADAEGCNRSPSESAGQTPMLADQQE